MFLVFCCFILLYGFLSSFVLFFYDFLVTTRWVGLGSLIL